MIFLALLALPASCAGIVDPDPVLIQQGVNWFYSSRRRRTRRRAPVTTTTTTTTLSEGAACTASTQCGGSCAITGPKYNQNCFDGWGCINVGESTGNETVCCSKTIQVDGTTYCADLPHLSQCFHHAQCGFGGLGGETQFYCKGDYCELPDVNEFVQCGAATSGHGSVSCKSLKCAWTHNVGQPDYNQVCCRDTVEKNGVTYCSNLPSTTPCDYKEQCQQGGCAVHNYGHFSAKVCTKKSAFMTCSSNQECVSDNCHWTKHGAEKVCCQWDGITVNGQPGKMWCDELADGSHCDWNAQCDGRYCNDGKCSHVPPPPPPPPPSVTPGDSRAGHSGKLFKKAGLIYPPMEGALLTGTVEALKRVLGMSLVPACYQDDWTMNGVAKNKYGRPKPGACPSSHPNNIGGKCRANCEGSMNEWCDSKCFNPRLTNCGKMRGEQFFAVFQVILNFLPGIGQIKKAYDAVKVAKAAGQAAMRAAVRTAIRECAKEVLQNLMWGAVANAIKFIAIKGKAIKIKYLEGMLDGEEESLASESVMSAMTAESSVAEDIKNVMKEVDPTGIAAMLAVFNKPECSKFKPFNLTLDSAFDFFPLCLLEGHSDCTHYTSTGWA